MFDSVRCCILSFHSQLTFGLKNFGSLVECSFTASTIVSIRCPKSPNAVFFQVFHWREAWIEDDLAATSRWSENLKGNMGKNCKLPESKNTLEFEQLELFQLMENSPFFAESETQGKCQMYLKNVMLPQLAWYVCRDVKKVISFAGREILDKAAALLPQQAERQSFESQAEH